MIRKYKVLFLIMFIVLLMSLQFVDARVKPKKSLIGKVITIDAGHGGTDGGASGNGIIEKDLTLDISQYMYNRFRELGIPVTMTRTTDETLSPTVRVERIMNAYGDEPGVIVISNHINAGGGEFSYHYII